MRDLPIKSSDEDTNPERDEVITENLDGNGTANDFLNIGPNQGQLRHEPEQKRGPVRVLLAANLGQVAPGGDAEAEREELDEKPHGGGPHEEPEERVPGDCSGLDVAFQIPRI
nr:hypothetical protein OsI_12560 [Ipomoea trifida]